MKRILFIGMLFIIMSQNAFAQTFSVQGVLRDPLGKTVDDGYYSVTFRLYEQSTGGTAIWSETQSSVEVLHGVFNVELGIINSLSDAPFDTTYWLGISIEGGTELEPRFKLLKAPAAMSVLGTDNVFPSKGNIGSGTLNPTAGLHIVTQSPNTDLLKIEGAGGGFIKVTSDGKMGVNVSDPNNPLAISGNLRLRDGGAIVFDDGTQIASANFGGSATGVASPGNALITSDAEGIGAGEIQFFIDTDPKMVIDHDGNVGIGTMSASTKLHVKGSTPTDAVLFLQPSKFNSTGDYGELRIGDTNHYIRGEWGNGMTFYDLDKFSFTGGNVGIGTTTPDAKLDVTGAIEVDGIGLPHNYGPDTNYVGTAGNYIAFGHSGTSEDFIGYKNNTFYFKDSPGGADMLDPNVIFGGNVGIGTTDLSFPLKIGGYTDRSIGQYGYLNKDGPGSAPSGISPVGIWVDQRVVAAEFNAVSDKRIKNIIGVSNSIEDLETLNQLEVTDYTYIDVVAKGDAAYKKLIAQQVQEVYPEAVKTDIDFIPNVYEMSTSTTYDADSKRLTITIAKAHNIIMGDKVRIVDNVGTHEVEILAVADEHTFTVSCERASEEVFVFGRQVDDFLAIDYDAISMLNISATQELAQQVEALQAENATLKAELSTLKSQFSSDYKRLEAMLMSSNENNKGQVTGDDDGLAAVISE